MTVNKFRQNWLSTPDVEQKTENLPKIKKTSSPNLMYFYCMHNYNFRTQYAMGLVQTAIKGYWQHFRFLCGFCVTNLPTPRWTCPCVCFINNTVFRHSTSYFLRSHKFENAF